MGNYNPDWMGGLSNSFSFKGIELSILLDMRMGGDVFSFTEANLTFDGYSEATLEEETDLWLTVFGKLPMRKEM